MYLHIMHAIYATHISDVIGMFRNCIAVQIHALQTPTVNRKTFINSTNIQQCILILCVFVMKIHLLRLIYELRT